MIVPNSAGSQRPSLIVPDYACDAHLHIYDPRFPEVADAASALDRATVAQYRLLQQRLGTRRAVIVTPRSYGTDNRVTVDAIAQLGQDHARGVAVLSSNISDEAMDELDRAGIRGVRFSLYTPKNAAVSFEMVEPLAKRIMRLGWHLQLHWTADQFVEYGEMLKRLPCPLVIDHMGRLPQPLGLKHAAVGLIEHLLERGNTWIKLSGAYLDSQIDESQGFSDVDAVVCHWIACAPDRLVWGSDWPHPTEKHKPDDAKMLDRLGIWTKDQTIIEKILVHNPAKLYGFAPISR
ncbi:amidohydrolase family protein [Zwartia vadi]|uniref:amidohydrolase family protein n=1 Tax=Zwartia vadi TaxID=3058168 RepID=UPI0025B41E64|nr:amidohydrolase family protein [Zwartia vadi]MDN3988274.1 amidohydrolase family protein [Zwartia vadi]